MAARNRAVTTVAGLAVIAAAAAACTSTPQPLPGEPTTTAPASARAAPSPEPAPGQVPGVAIPDGRIEAAIHGLGGLAAAARSSGVQGFAVAVVHDGAVVFEHGYGTVGGTTGGPQPATASPTPAPATPASPSTGSASRRPVDTDTVFPLGALSVPVSATVVATQLTDGRTWSTPVRELMPQFALADPYATGHATLGDAFSGTLGLPADAGAAAARIGIDRQLLLDRLAALPSSGFRGSARPGDAGPTLGGEAVARAAGTDWATLAQRSLFDRLGMKASGYRSADSASSPDASGQDRAWADAVAPALGLSSSAHDMATWMQTVLAGGMHQGTRVIPADALTAALSPQTVTARPAGSPVDLRATTRGLGFDITDSPAGRVVITAGGSGAGGSGAGHGPDGGADAALTMIPSADLGIVTLTTGPSGAGPEHAASAAQVLNAGFADLAQFGSIQRDWAKWLAGPTPQPAPSTGTTSPSAPPAPLPGYDGVYTNPFFGQASVHTGNDTTVLTVGPARLAFRLTRRGGDTFTVAPLDPGDRAAAAVAARSSDPTAAFDGDALSLSFLDQAGPFRR